jgi:spermidine synthase
MTPQQLWTETLYSAYGQSFRVDEVLFEEKSEHQHLLIFQNEQFGRVLALDGIVQTTERDEFIYHEMLTHVPLITHGNAERVLIIGGGDGGILREVCRHNTVKHITQVEIDQSVIELSKTWFPGHSNGAYDDPRAHIIIGDGFDFVQKTADRFDVVISDSTDPSGPGEVLFSKDFYAGCQRSLNAGGILVTQNGVPFMQPAEFSNTAARLSRVFKDRRFYGAPVPSYIGGLMTFAWASDNPDLLQTSVDTLAQRWYAQNIQSRYYTPELHHAAFALPRYLLDMLQSEYSDPAN